MVALLHVDGLRRCWLNQVLADLAVQHMCLAYHLAGKACPPACLCVLVLSACVLLDSKQRHLPHTDSPDGAAIPHVHAAKVLLVVWG